MVPDKPDVELGEGQMGNVEVPWSRCRLSGRARDKQEHIAVAIYDGRYKTPLIVMRIAAGGREQDACAFDPILPV